MPRGIHFSVEDVRNLIRAHGATPLISEHKYRTPLQYICATSGCHTQHSIRIDVLRKYPKEKLLVCRACFLKDHREKLGVDENRVRLYFEKQGATLLTSYENLNTLLKYVCREPGCSNENQVSWRNIHTRIEQGKEWALRCRKCHVALSYLRGSEAPTWKPELTEEHRKRTQRRPVEISVWYRRVLAKDSFTCIISGQVGGKLSAHHLFNYADFPQYSFRVGNGVSLTREIHEDFHFRYGRGRNTPDQLKEYAEKYHGVSLNLPSEFCISISELIT